MFDLQTKTPTKRKNSISNKQGKKDSPKKAKLENAKTPQKNTLLDKITPKQQNANKKQNLQVSNQTPNKRNKRKSDNEPENGSQKKLKPFSGTAEIIPLAKNKQQPAKKEKKAKEGEQSADKKKRRDQFLGIITKVKSGEKEDALKDIDNKIKAIESRDTELTKTAKRKLKRLIRLKNVCEGKDPVQVQQKKNPNAPSESTKRRMRKQKALKLTSEGNAGKKVSVIAQKQTAGVKANGKSDKITKVNKQVKLEELDDDESDDELEGESEDESEGESGEEEEVEGGQGSDESDEENEEEEVDEEETDDDSEEESPPKPEDKSKMSPKKKEKLNKAGENKSVNVKDVNLEELKKSSLVNKNQKRFVLFVGNIPYDTNKNDLSDHFKKCGEIKHIRIPTEKKSTKPRGFAYVEVGDEESYQKCLSVHHSFLKGRRINVLYTQGGKKKGDEKKKEIKAKNFKLHAMRKQGMLAGSKKETQKRSFRRAKQRAGNKESEVQE